MRFSIGLPVTKTIFLESTILSILSQTYPEYEVIIQNNAENNSSREEIRNIIHPYLKHNNFQYYENEEQLNISDNFNLILNKAIGDYFIILSDDDLLLPKALEEYDKLINEFKECNIYHCRVRLINELNNVIHFTPICDKFETLPDFMFHRLAGYRQQFLSDFLVSRKKLIEIGGFPVLAFGWGVDDLTWFLLAENGIAYTPFIGLNYRVFSNNLTNSKMGYKTSLLKLIDIDTIYKRFSEITSKNSFKEKSIYTNDIFDKLINKAKTKAFCELFRIIGTKNNLVSTFLFYLKNKKKYGLNFIVFLYAVKGNLIN